MRYLAKSWDSPARIASRHGISTGALLAANPHKPTVTSGGRQTWATLGVGEQVEVPVGIGFVADVATDAVNALKAAGGPCIQGNAGLVCAIQAVLGLTQDGKYGSGTAAAAKKLVPSAPAACNPAPLWWGKKGESKCAGAAIPQLPSAGLPPLQSLPPLPTIPGPIPGAIPAIFTPPPLAMPSIAAAVSALASADPCYSGNAAMVCAAQAALGLTQDGKYGADTAAGLKRILGSAPPPCSPAPLWWGKKGESKCGGVLPSLPSLPISLPSPAPVTFQPPTPGDFNTPVFSPSPSVPAPSPSPVYSQPTPQPVYSQPAPSPAPAPVYSQPAPQPVYSQPAPQPGAPSPAPIVNAPTEKQGLSTGAIVGIAVGGAALVGLVVLAATSKKSTSVTRTSTVRRAPARKKRK